MKIQRRVKTISTTVGYTITLTPEEYQAVKMVIGKTSPDWRIRAGMSPPQSDAVTKVYSALVDGEFGSEVVEV